MSHLINRKELSELWHKTHAMFESVVSLYVCENRVTIGITTIAALSGQLNAKNRIWNRNAGKNDVKFHTAYMR